VVMMKAKNMLVVILSVGARPCLPQDAVRSRSGR
jgi:hypothetical protein